MIRLEITLKETKQGLTSRTKTAKTSATGLELQLAGLVENVTACALKNAVLLKDGRARMNVPGFLADFPRMVVGD